MKKVEFKSNPEIWKKEMMGIKPNTFRKVDMNDERFKILKQFSEGYINYLDIKIINEIECRAFERQVKDVTFWEDYVIISWRA